MPNCDVCNGVLVETNSVIVKGVGKRNQLTVCLIDCEDEVIACRVCGWLGTDPVCSEECAHKSYYGTAHPDSPEAEDTPSLDPPHWKYV